SFFMCNCDSPNTPEEVVGTYRSTSAPTLTLELRADGSAVERIGGRELHGRWSLWSTTQRGCGVIRSRIEVTGLVLDAGERQTNNRMHGHLQKWPRKLVLELENSAKKLELSSESTPR